MKNLYRRLEFEVPPKRTEHIKGVLSRGSVSPEDRRDVEAVLLDQRRRRVYDQTWQTLTTIGQLRANLGLTHAENWSEHEFDTRPTRASELDVLKQFVGAAGRATEQSRKSSGGGRYLLLVVLIGVLYFVITNQDFQFDTPKGSPGSSETVSSTKNRSTPQWNAIRREPMCSSRRARMRR